MKAGRTVKRVICLAAALVMLLGASGCGGYKYTDGGYLRCIDPKGYTATYCGEFSKLTTERATYWFADTVTKSQRDEYVFASEKILANLDITLPAIYLFSSYGVRIDESGALYSGVEYRGCAEQIAYFLLAHYGRFANFGLAYGLANLVADELQWDNTEATKLLLPQEEAIYDINFLCFAEQFASQSDITAAKSLCLTFAAEKGREETGRLLALSASADSVGEFAQSLEKWYLQKGITASVSRVLYGFGSYNMDYIAQTDRAEYLMFSNWHEEFYTPTMGASFLHADYGTVKEFFETVTADMSACAEFFGLPDGGRLTVSFFNEKDNWSWYTHATRSISLSTVTSLMHEYVHSLTVPYCNPEYDWVTEGIASYYCQFFDRFGNTFQRYYYDSLGEGRYPYYDYFMEVAGLPMTDEGLLLRDDTNCRFFDRYSIINTYPCRSSYVKFLSLRFGDEALLPCLVSADGKYEPLPEPHAELLEKWRGYVKSTYPEPGK